MNIQNRKELRSYAAAAVAENPGDPRMTVLIYVLITAVSSLLVSILTTALDTRIAQTGGLSNLGLRSTLSTIRQAAPLILSLALMGLDLGRKCVSLRIVRRVAVEPRNLGMGFSRLGALLRSVFLQGAIYLLALIVAVNIGTVIFMATPLARDLTDILVDLSMASDEMYNALYNDPELLNRMFSAMLPAYPICMAVFALLAAPIFYQFRMTDYCLVDERMGAVAAMDASRRMTKGHRFQLFKLDLGFWWFWLGQLVCAAIIYGDVILSQLGIVLPLDPTAVFYILYVTALVLEGVLYYFTLIRVDAAYAAAYDALRPKPPQGGVVLGNIFDLARDHKEN